MAPTVPFGRLMRQQHFLFADGHIPLNGGSFGTFPRSVKAAADRLRDQTEQRPDRFLFHDFESLLSESRFLVAKLLNVQTDEVVIVPNASTASDTVMRNIVWAPGDVFLTIASAYPAVTKSALYLEETTNAESEVVDFQWPLSHDEVVRLFEQKIQDISVQSEGRRRVKLAVFDTIGSAPGVRIPFERLTEVCKKHNVLSLIDGAHGIGHIPLDLGKLRPDFFVSNLHKWLFVPRGCAVLYVRTECQHLIRACLPTSHGFRPIGERIIPNPLTRFSTASPFVELFQFVGTIDPTPYLTVKDALAFRSDICGGEGPIMEYNMQIAAAGGSEIAKILGTEVLDNSEKNLTKCAFANIRLPLEIGEQEGQIPSSKTGLVTPWIRREADQKFDTYFLCFLYGGSYWWRVSGQIYLELDDFIRGGNIMKELCDQVRKGEVW